ncbi:MAG: hypothetical protein QNJ55_35815 [Xenococcus sp. MO_188.B8]|nr:hypothetical protein [Xenococcus sp. MO_188.B8]
MKQITKIQQAKFKVATPGVTGSELELDFQPVIDEFGLDGDFILIHWQARPKGHREWGIYSSRGDSYRSTKELAINLASVKSLQLDDATAKTIPSAVLYVQEERITCINERSIIGAVLLSDVA